MLEDDDVLLLVDAPIIDPRDLEQFRYICVASLARRARHAPRQNAQSSTAPMPKNASESRQDSHKRRLPHAFEEDVASDDTREEQRIKLDANASTRSPPASRRSHASAALIPRSRCFTPLPAIPHSIHHQPSFLMCRTLVAAPDASVDMSADISSLKPGITKSERKSLVPMGTSSGNSDGSFTMYTICLTLCPDRTSLPDLRAFGGIKYRLLLDTGDSSFWFFANDFQELLVFGDFPPIECAWDEDPATQDEIDHQVIPRGPPALLMDTKELNYFDTGKTYVSRWPDSVPFLVPGWDWGKNAADPKATLLRFPRVLATHVNRKVAIQPVDGNLGLAVPGYRYPWGTPKLTEDSHEPEVTEADRLTFFDILTNGRAGVSRVDQPRQLTIRLLVPDSMTQAITHAGMRQSFLYFGSGHPCGMPGPEDNKLLLLDYTPRLYIFPTIGADLKPIFDMWRLRLVSLSLLRPLVPNPNHEILVEGEWDAQRILMAPTQALDGPPPPAAGIPVIFDTGCGCSVLPTPVIQAIWMSWFQQDLKEFSIGTPEQPFKLWHGREDNFAKHDMLFEFLDSTGRTFTFRCGAEHFLSSPWKTWTDKTLSLFQPLDLNEEDPVDFVLGMNFFWAAFMKMDAEHSGTRPNAGFSGPAVQFAAQRIVHNGAIVAGPYEFGLHADLPPRLQAIARGQPEIRPD